MDRRGSTPGSATGAVRNFALGFARSFVRGARTCQVGEAIRRKKTARGGPPIHRAVGSMAIAWRGLPVSFEQPRARGGSVGPGANPPGVRIKHHGGSHATSP